MRVFAMQNIHRSQQCVHQWCLTSEDLNNTNIQWNYTTTLNHKGNVRTQVRNEQTCSKLELPDELDDNVRERPNSLRLSSDGKLSNKIGCWPSWICSVELKKGRSFNNFKITNESYFHHVVKLSIKISYEKITNQFFSRYTRWYFERVEVRCVLYRKRKYDLDWSRCESEYVFGHSRKPQLKE